VFNYHDVYVLIPIFCLHVLLICYFICVGNNTERGDESVLSSQIFPFSNPDHIRYFS